MELSTSVIGRREVVVDLPDSGSTSPKLPACPTQVVGQRIDSVDAAWGGTTQRGAHDC